MTSAALSFLQPKHAGYEALRALRANDRYPDAAHRRAWITTLFPAAPEDAVVGLSNVTAAFFGLLLRNAEAVGGTPVDVLSRALFRDLGRLKAQEVVAKMPSLPRDTRGLAVVLVSAIFTASPEYTFSIDAYAPERTVLHLSGHDRYHRIAAKLGFERRLAWPTLVPFFEGIASELGVSCSVDADVLRLDADSTCEYVFEFSMI
jgi:hypothetical protein